MKTATTKERPILFSPAMVRAILDGRKTQTRRVVEGVDHEVAYKPIPIEAPHWSFSPGDDYATGRDIRCPYGLPGDRLWVRETFCEVTVPGHCGEILYRADGFPEGEQYQSLRKIWTPAIHMPKEVCRLKLELTAVRVERLQEISEKDCFAEGIHEPQDVPGYPGSAEFFKGTCIQGEYKDLWDSLNAKRGYGWDVNPWVWVLEFKRVQL